MTHRQAVSSRLRLRRAQADDCTAIRQLLIALGYEAGGGATLSDLLRAALDRPDFAIFLALDQDEPLGTPLGLIQLSQRPQLHLGGTLVSIDALTVRPEARGKGIGQRLLRRARAYARLHRAVRIEVHTTRTRENYHRGFYPTNGYDEANSALFRLERAQIVASKQ